MDSDVTLMFKGHDLVIVPHKYLALEGIQDLLVWSKPERLFHSLPLYYTRIKKYFENRQYSIQDMVLSDSSPDYQISPNYILRPYQREALKNWEDNGAQGIVLIGTGGGKTFVGLDAINHKRCRTLIIVPTLDLIKQWKKNIIDYLGINPQDVGVFRGGKQQLRDITITTYVSAYIHILKFRSKYDLVVFDEVHHLFAPSYRLIAEGLISKYRLGLTATLDDLEPRFLANKHLTGEIVYRVSPRDLERNEYIASFEVKKIYTNFTPQERIQYDKFVSLYRDYIYNHQIQMRQGNDFQKLVMLSGRDLKARKALQAHNKARRLAFFCQNKMAKVETLLKKHRKEKVLIFSEYNKTIQEVRRRFLIPTITHRTPSDERHKIFQGFKDGTIQKIASTRVLDEGVDVNDVAIGIIISGSSVKRQTIQRLGRLLRKKEKTAILYELVTKGTSEVFSSERRSPDF